MAGWAIDAKFRIPENEGVLRYIEAHQFSAHSDVASELIDAANGLRGVRWYCPDAARYAFVVLHTTRNVIFGLAYGMSGIALRVRGTDVARVHSLGGAPHADLGDEWVDVELYASGMSLAENRMRLAGLVSIALNANSA